MEKPASEIGLEQSVFDLSAVLEELRDALDALSLALSEWQMKFDVGQQIILEEKVRQLLQQIAAR
jgi:hypothetical protein